MFCFKQLDVIREAELDRIIPFFPRGSRILEIGAGTGRQSLNLQRRGFDVTAIEIGDSAYSAHRVFPITDYDGRTLPLHDRSIDVVFSSNVLEHVGDLPHMHAEIRRVLTPGGRCLHILPTHVWRFWTTLSGYPDALLYILAGAPQLVPRAWPRSKELNRLGTAWYQMARAVGGRWLPRRHGERGNIISELLLFHPRWWQRHFLDHGFALLQEAPMGLFYTGNMLLGQRLGLPRRRRLADVLGSACHLFELAPREGPRRTR